MMIAASGDEVITIAAAGGEVITTGSWQLYLELMIAVHQFQMQLLSELVQIIKYDAT